MKKLKGIGLIAILVLIDQLTKIWAKSTLSGGKVISIIKNVFCLEYVENRGAAFGMLQNKVLFFLVITIIVLAGIYFVFKRMPEDKKYRPLSILLLVMVAGAIGNLIDRLIYNYVVDFLYFELIDFPVFNVADCYVTVSAITLFVLFLFYYKDEDFHFLTKKKEK
ncbi:lipoprotein signal peptidase [Lachnospiraceae bacterium KM106-2]|nr:lipoprotein signal peptidase [Lachnospiraceae bacterium KM106-2]